MFMDFILSLIGTVPAELHFIVVLAAAVLLLLVSSLVIGFFLSAISGLTIKFFK